MERPCRVHHTVQPVANRDVNPLRASREQQQRLGALDLADLLDDPIGVGQHDVADDVRGLPRLDAQPPTQLRRLDDHRVPKVGPPGNGEPRFLEDLTLQSLADRLAAIDHTTGRRPFDGAIPAAGYRAYRSDALERMEFDTVAAEGYGFQVEMTYRLVRIGGKVVEFPITFRDRTEGSSKMSGGIVREALVIVIKLWVGDFGGRRRRRAQGG